MDTSNSAPRPYEPPFVLRRPTHWEDFYRIEQHVRYWWGMTRIYRPMQVSALYEVPANACGSESAGFYATTLGRDHRINPQAKNWCFFLLEDAFRNIIGLYYSAGMTEQAKERHLQPQLGDLPIEGLPWRELYVPDPAHPETGRYGYVTILANWRDPHSVQPLLEAAYKTADLLEIETLFTEIIHSGPADNVWMAEQLGFRKLRTCASQTPERTPISVWVWQRPRSAPILQRQYQRELEASPAQVAALTTFYQQLSRAEREELGCLIDSCTIAATVERTGLRRRTVEARRTALRRALDEWGEGEEDGERLRGLGIDLSRGYSGDLASLFCQPAVAQALKRIAWFYGQLSECQ